MTKLTATELREELHYDPDTGIFTWLKIAKGRYVGSVAGCASGDGYRRIHVGGRSTGRLYYAHRLAWLYMTGEWPSHQIDHINRDPKDNRWCNLRAATPRQNRGNRHGAQRNSWTGIRGVHYRTDIRKWMAHISPHGKLKVLGYFANLEDARAARSKASREFFGEFSQE